MCEGLLLNSLGCCRASHVFLGVATTEGRLQLADLAVNCARASTRVGDVKIRPLLTMKGIVSQIPHWDPTELQKVIVQGTARWQS